MYEGLSISANDFKINKEKGILTFEEWLERKIKEITELSITSKERKVIDTLGKMLIITNRHGNFIDYVREDASLTMQIYEPVVNYNKNVKCAVTGLFQEVMYVLNTSVPDKNDPAEYTGPGIYFCDSFCKALLRVANDRNFYLLTNKIV